MRAGAFADGRDVLAGEPAAQHVDRFDLVPADGGDVAEVRRVGPVMGEDAGDGLVEFGELDRAAAGGVLDGEVQASVPGEQGPDLERAVIGRGCVVHEGSGRSVNPIPDCSRRPSSGRSPARCTTPEPSTTRCSPAPTITHLTRPTTRVL